MTSLATPLRQGERTPGKPPERHSAHAQAHEDHGRAEPQTARINEQPRHFHLGRTPHPCISSSQRIVMSSVSTHSAKPACLSLIVDICPYPESADARTAQLILG